jgi:hypothetical protein
MPRVSNPQLSNAYEQDVNAASAPAGSTPEGDLTPTVPSFRKGFMKDSQFEVLMGMGEGEYQQMMESLHALEGSTQGAGVNPAAAHFRQREQKRTINYTFEAGMCMKTKDHKTQCPKRNRLFGLNFRHLRRIERYFAANCCFVTTNCQTHAISHGFLHRAENLGHRCGAGT